MSKKEVLPVVIYQQHHNYAEGVYTYQVFLGEYDRGTHTVVKVSDDYVCFKTNEEVEAYIRGLQKSGVVYGVKS